MSGKKFEWGKEVAQTGSDIAELAKDVGRLSTSPPSSAHHLPRILRLSALNHVNVETPHETPSWLSQANFSL